MKKINPSLYDTSLLDEAITLHFKSLKVNWNMILIRHKKRPTLFGKHKKMETYPQMIPFFTNKKLTHKINGKLPTKKGKFSTKKFKSLPTKYSYYTQIRT